MLLFVELVLRMRRRPLVLVLVLTLPFMELAQPLAPRPPSSGLATPPRP